MEALARRTARKRSLHIWLRTLRDALLPPECLLCGGSERLRRGFDACHGCLADLPLLQNACERCADSLVTAAGTAVWCGACLVRPPPFYRTRCLGRFEGGLAALVRGLKYQRRLENARLLGQLMGRQLAAYATEKPMVLVPVPLHWARLRQRGFNQATEIARWAGRESGLTVDPYRVRRTRGTLSQTGLGARARRANLRDAFSCRRRIDNWHAAIVDDVMTTGSTAASLATTLLRAGCARVEVWCCARASL